MAALRDPDYQTVKPLIYELPGVRFSSQTVACWRRAATSRTQVLPAVRKLVENDIAGNAGFRVSTVDAQGTEVEELYSKAPEPAKAVTIALSRAIQAAAEDAVEPVTQPAILVAIQPSTGDMLAVAQNDPADAQGALALTGRFPPGSTIKVVTALAVLQSGKVNADTPVPCPGKTTIDGRRIVPNTSEFDKGTIPLHVGVRVLLQHHVRRRSPSTCRRRCCRTPRCRSASASTSTSPGLTTITGSVPPADRRRGTGRGRVRPGQGAGQSPFGMALVAATIAKGTMPVPPLVRGKETKADKQPAAPPAAVLDPVRADDARGRRVGHCTATQAVRGRARQDRYRPVR